MIEEPTPEEIEAAIPAAEAKKVIKFAKQASHLPSVHRMLPQNDEAEMGLLSCILLSPRDLLDACVSRGVTPSWFFVPRNSEIFRAFLRMDDERKPIDLITVTAHLRDATTLDAVGGPAYLTDLQTYVGTAMNALHYLEILDEKRQLRDLIEHATLCASRAYGEQDAVDELMDTYEQGALKIRASRFGKVQVVTTKQLVIEAIGDIESMYETRGTITGIATGIAGVDRVTNGLQNSEVTIVAARPSHGKTSMLLNWIEHMAIENEIPCLVFSLEMSGRQLMKKLISSRARVNLRRLQDGVLSERDFPAISEAGSAISAAPILIDDFTEGTIQYVRAKARRWVSDNRKRGVQNMVVAIDYLQLIGGGSRGNQFQREREVADVSRGLKLMSHELGIPVVVAAQLGRANVKEKRRPKLHDLRESGSIESDADNVLLLDRDEMNVDPEDHEAMRECEGRAELIVAKQRNGEVGTSIPLMFLKEFCKFETRAFSDIAPPEKPDKPARRAGRAALMQVAGPSLL